MTPRAPFIREQKLAVFLDVDGTLLEIASTPDAVKVSGALRNTLELAAARENGALALISGRSIKELDRLFAPCLFPAAGQHGFERRNAQGRLMQPALDHEVLQRAREALSGLQLLHKGLLMEDKGAALAMHYRLAPLCESAVRKVMAELAVPLAGQFVLRAGKCVLELTPAGCSKRTAIEAFMSETPFSGRAPVFIGDDLTDEDGFAAVNELGGYSIHVGNARTSAARYHFASVSTVIAWLRERNLNQGQSTR
jgi:trehalose 6-phosphate phosphatase